MNDPKIHLAFRFHGNFYHSYRGDTPDELGFGKDIRIIRHLIRVLDELNSRGIPVCGTWDFENYFSLEKLMPEHCPDIISDMQRRVADGRDEMQFMSYNNGLVSASTAREFEDSIKLAVSNANGSGLRDLFGDNYGSMVRPQEMMYSPIHLKMYKYYGIDAISLFYSSLPFNGFSNFIPELSFEERYNPLNLSYPGIEESMILMPCYNTGDLADNISIRMWIKRMRKQQLALQNPRDIMLLIDMDADDEFWIGFDVPILKKHFSTAGGLKGLVEGVADLDYVEFSTPCRYLKDHEPVGEISIGQDTADGSFDGIASWAEKWVNQKLWTGIERSRILEQQIRHLMRDIGKVPKEVEVLLDKSHDSRLKALSTTHFGMAAPIMNVTRLGTGRDIVRDSVDKARQAFDLVAEQPADGFSLLDYKRGVDSEVINYQPCDSKSLVRLSLKKPASLCDRDGKPLPCILKSAEGQHELLFVQSNKAEQRQDYKLDSSVEPLGADGVKLTENTLGNSVLTLNFDQNGQLKTCIYNGLEIATSQLLSSSITYAGKRYTVGKWQRVESECNGVFGFIRMRGEICFKSGGTRCVSVEREIMLAADMPYIYVNMRLDYPETPHQKYGKGKAKRLERSWDENWQEVIPCEINPALDGNLRLWKHNYCNHVSSFKLDYSSFSKNEELDSINNQVTNGWVAVSDGSKGILVAQNADINSSMAFCPIRTRRNGQNSTLSLNPFGSYWGKQYRYATAYTGLGKFLAVQASASDHIKPYAPDYSGHVQEFSIMIAPYRGDMPPENIQNDAMAYSYPAILLSGSDLINEPAHRSWDGKGLGRD